MVENVLAEIRSHFVRLAETAQHLLRFIQAIITTESLPFAFCILLQEQWRGRHLVNGFAAAHTNGHAALLAVQHEALHLLVVATRRRRLRLRLRVEVRCLAFAMANVHLL